ncbi:GNAT family N-acetyltransferase [Paenibacillus aurantius]|uniref:GNAT family N-acetyltransferase n=1 Tax=Paenibacillus aurantius TaxID=2918900 RepID=A0AA96LEM4_9BACL|nr:GNAT family N-acetyltransferase [Paenibacillus aurantius]WNQ11925.1 GNAT family N-acetyltransferase [Paenibacillus aurantius]
MLINIKDRLDEPAIQELLACSVFPDPDRVMETIETYRREPERELYGHESEGEIIGLIGFRLENGGTLTIDHLAVRPDCRGAGFGRGLLLETLELKEPREMVAETDEDAVDFYRSTGFIVVSLGENYPGAERFRCIYRAEE